MGVMPQADVRHWIASVLGGHADADLYVKALLTEVLDQSELDGVTPLLRHHLEQTGQLEFLPRGLQARFQQIDRKHLAADMATQDELLYLLKILQSHNIDFIMLKGEALSHSIYPLPHLRTKTDIDLLFSSKAESERASKILETEGYQRMLSQQGTFVGYQFVCHKQYANGFRMVFDIHNEITNYLWFNRKLRYQYLLENSNFIEIENVKVRVLNTIHALIHACVHRITNKSNDTEDRLIWLYDIHLLGQSLSDTQWQNLVQVCSNKDLSEIVRQGLQVSHETLASSLPPKFIDQLKSNALTSNDPFSQKRRRIHMYWSDFILNKGFANKLTQIRERVFPPADYMLKRYDLKSSRWLVYYYLKRVAKVIIKR
ncbi:MAG: hypothetical protein ACI9WC_002790 [Arenicella sp.]|jgi:hypothetical protein